MEDVDGLKQNIVSLQFNTLSASVRPRRHPDPVNPTMLMISDAGFGSAKVVEPEQENVSMNSVQQRLYGAVLSHFLLSTNTSCNTDQYFHAHFLVASTSHYRDYNLSCSYQRIG
jgi:hypothetical protein